MELSKCCESYYARQSGRGGITVYEPQIGHGFFGNLLKGATTFLKNTVAPTLIKGAANLATDALEGRDFKESAKKRASETLTDTISTIIPPRTRVKKRKTKRVKHVQF